MSATNPDSSFMISSGRQGKGIPFSPWLLALLFIVGFGPLIIAFFANLWKYEIHQFYPLALIGAAALAWRGCCEVPLPLRSGSSLWTGLMTLLSLALLTFASLLWSPWIGVASMLVGLAALASWLGGRSFSLSLLPSWIMLLTVIPPPLKLDARLALQMQQWAVAGSSRVLDLMAVPHLREGNILQIPGQRLLVEEACSGINSVLFMSAACVFYVLWQRRPLIFLPLLYTVTIGSVLFGNLIRITSGAWLLFNFRIDLFTGWRHETLGLVLTASYLIVIVLSDALLARVTARMVAKHADRIAANRVSPARKFSFKPLLEGRCLSGIALILLPLFLVLGSLQLGEAWFNSDAYKKEVRINPEGMKGSAKFSMPKQIDDWVLVTEEVPVAKKTAFEDGVYSHTWQYRNGGLNVMISLDYPFFDYHDVRICYSGGGWTIDESKVHPAHESADDIPRMEVLLSKENGLKGELLYSTVDESGSWLDDSGDRAVMDESGRQFEGGFVTRILARLRKFHGILGEKQPKVNYRIQLLSTAQGGLDSKQVDMVTSFFRTVRKKLSDQFIIAPKPTMPVGSRSEDGIVPAKNLKTTGPNSSTVRSEKASQTPQTLQK